MSAPDKSRYDRHVIARLYEQEADQLDERAACWGQAGYPNVQTELMFAASSLRAAAKALREQAEPETAKEEHRG